MFQSLSKLEAALSEMLYKVILPYEVRILSSIFPAEQGAMLHQGRRNCQVCLHAECSTCTG